jgi:hypothetical protein
LRSRSGQDGSVGRQNSFVEHVRIEVQSKHRGCDIPNDHEKHRLTDLLASIMIQLAQLPYLSDFTGQAQLQWKKLSFSAVA